MQAENLTYKGFQLS